MCIQRLSFGAVGSIRLAMMRLQWAEERKLEATVIVSLVPNSHSNLGTRLQLSRGNPANLLMFVCVLCHESRSFEITPSTLEYYLGILLNFSVNYSAFTKVMLTIIKFLSSASGHTLSKLPRSRCSCS